MSIEQEYLTAEVNVLEYIVDLGIKGNHLLFDNERIREALRKDLGNLAEDGSLDVDEVNRVIREIFAIPGFEEKKDYIENLPMEVQDVIIILYFQLIDRNMMTDDMIVH